MLSIILCIVLLSALGPLVEGDYGHGHGHDRIIKPCLRPCAKIYAPVCAIPVGASCDPKTFGNECELHNHNCDKNNQQYKFSHDGECKKKCNQICTADYDPICAEPVSGCGGEHKEFGNKCKLELYNCRNPTKQYKLHKKGPCHKLHHKQ